MKKKKKRTQNKFENAIISAIRTAFARYSPKYEQVLFRSRVEADKKNKDGSISKVKDVSYTCDGCGSLTKKPDVDHIEPVIEPGKTRKDYSFDEIISRIDCDIGNLQVLCETCHKNKTDIEREKRKKK